MCRNQSSLEKYFAGQLALRSVFTEEVTEPPLNFNENC